MMCGSTVRAALSFSPIGFGGGKAPSQAFPNGKKLYPNAFARGGLVNYPFVKRQNINCE